MAVFGLILFILVMQYMQASVSTEKTATLLLTRKNISSQEKAKYLYVGMEKCASVCHNNEKMGFQYDLMKNKTAKNEYIK